MVDDDVQNIFVEGNDGYQKAKQYIKQLMPKQIKKVKKYRDKIPLFFKNNIEGKLYEIYKTEVKLKSAEEYIGDILKTWQNRGIKPKFHVSEQGSGRCGHHSDYIEIIPDYLLEIPEKYNQHIDIMIEAKKKELSIFKLYEKYPFFNCKLKDLNIKINVKEH